jgi:ketosteroid isomerase-like protein
VNDGIQVKIEGLDALRAELLKLPQVLQARIMKGASAKACSVFRADAVARAPFFTGSDADLADLVGGKTQKLPKGHPPPGTLKRAIYQARAAIKCTATTEVWVVNVLQGKAARNTKRAGTSMSLDAFYARWVEYGHYTRAPKSAGATGAARRRAVAQGTQLVKGAHFVMPQPFMRPAFETKQAEAMAAFAQYLRDNIPAAVQGLSMIKAKS